MMQVACKRAERTTERSLTRRSGRRPEQQEHTNTQNNVDSGNQIMYAAGTTPSRPVITSRTNHHLRNQIKVSLMCKANKNNATHAGSLSSKTINSAPADTANSPGPEPSKL